MGERSISIHVIERLTTYLRYLKSLPDDGTASVSATKIAAALDLNQVLVRKDLAEISSGGKPRVGYQICSLIEDIETSLGYNDSSSAILVGVGNLGRALLSHKSFRETGVRIVLAFDCDEAEIGTDCCGVRIMATEKMADLCGRLKVHIGIIAVPDTAAQEVCDMLVGCGIKAIWNFAPTHLKVPDDVIVRNENLAASLLILSQQLRERLS
ncbi:MAG: redox-sensing transcriptional repressor Rex [Clostridia bacterium]|nr:redox-sensing transcriptional repressor Rex [Clostridia bacterium]